MSTERTPKSTLLQDLQNIESLRKVSKLTEQEHLLMQAGVRRLMLLVNESYPDISTPRKGEDPANNLHNPVRDSKSSADLFPTT